MVTKKSEKRIYKGNEKRFKCFIKNQLIVKEDRNTGNEVQSDNKACKTQAAK